MVPCSKNRLPLYLETDLPELHDGFLVFNTGEDHVHCNRTYEKIGCFKRYPRHVGIRLFDILVLTDRDWGAPQYGGQDIDWFNWPAYLHG